MSSIVIRTGGTITFHRHQLKSGGCVRVEPEIGVTFNWDPQSNGSTVVVVVVIIITIKTQFPESSFQSVSLQMCAKQLAAAAT